MKKEKKMKINIEYTYRNTYRMSLDLDEEYIQYLEEDLRKDFVGILEDLYVQPEVLGRLMADEILDSEDVFGRKIELFYRSAPTHSAGDLCDVIRDYLHEDLMDNGDNLVDSTLEDTYVWIDD